MSVEIDQYLETLKRLTGAKNDSELADALGKAKQTISSWRRRGTVPTDVQYTLADLYGPEAALFREVRAATTERERQAILAVFLSLFDQHRAELDPSDGRDRYILWAQAFLHCEDDIRNAIHALGFVDPSDNQFTIAEMVKAMIDTGKVPGVRRALDVWVRRVEPVDQIGLPIKADRPS